MIPSPLFTLKNFIFKRKSIFVKQKRIKHDKKLTIVMSSIPQKQMLKKLSGNVVWLYENKISKQWTTKSLTQDKASGGWFIGDVDETLRVLKDIVEFSDAKDITLIGSSKSGFAALLYAHFLSIRFTRKNFRVLAFSPATNLPNLRYFEGDHQATLKELKENGRLDEEFDQYGDLHKVLEDSNIKKAIVVYSDGYKPDVTDYKHIQKLPFVEGLKIDKKQMETHNLHAHLTLEYLWTRFPDRFEQILSDLLCE